MMSELLAVETAQRVRYIYSNRNDTIENLNDLGAFTLLKVKSKVFVSTDLSSFLNFETFT